VIACHQEWQLQLSICSGQARMISAGNLRFTSVNSTFNFVYFAPGEEPPGLEFPMLSQDPACKKVS
jgi:hypothetical protein